MRTIKFRAWDKEKKIMKQVDFLHIKSGEVTFKCVNPLVCGGSYIQTEKHPAEFILLQFTGLKDKNGKEIYEGDIIEYWFYREDGSREPRKDVVKFITGCFVPDFWRGKEEPIVIGNIYENPELLK